MSFLTDFADQAVVLPLVIAVALGLLALGWRRGAVAWAVATGGTLGAMLALKLLFAACGPALGGMLMRSPSGHAASAAVVYGGLLGLALRRGVRGAAIAAAVLGAIIGATRVVLGAHTVAESALGALVGCAGASALVWLAGEPTARVRVVRLAALAVAVVILAHGFHLRAEASIRGMAERYAWLVPVCARQ
jgi:membrane-associated phospholipid phosphatase